MDGKNSISLSIKGQDLVPIIKQTLESGGTFKLLVTGMSMFPFIKHMRDSVILTHPSSRTIRRGEIVFIQRDSKMLVLHRVIRIAADGFIMNGDAQLWNEYISFNQVFAIVSKIERNGKIISCDSPIYRFLSLLWIQLRPIRRILLFGIRLPVRIFRKTRRILGLQP